MNIVEELETVAESFHRDKTAPYTMDLLLRARHEIVELRRNRRGEKLERMKLLRLLPGNEQMSGNEKDREN